MDFSSNTPSGNSKSSLVYAGLIPALKKAAPPRSETCCETDIFNVLVFESPADDYVHAITEMPELQRVKVFGMRTPMLGANVKSSNFK